MTFTWFRRIAAVAAISLFCPVVSQADNCASSACDDCCYSGDDCCGISGLGCGNGCGDSWFSGAYADVELNFMKSTKEGGVENAAGIGGEFDYEITPRVTLGVLRSDGLGIRTRFWDFSHTARSVGAAADDIQVDAYTWDLEVFERIDLNCNTSIEWSGGVRYTDLIEDLSSGGDFAQTTGFGGVVGLQLNRAVGRGEFYGRARFSIMSDDDAFREFADVNGNRSLDLLASQTEIGLGYEVVRHLDCCRTLRLRAGYEWQQWDGFAQGHDDFGVEEEISAAIGFEGFVLGASLDY